MKLNNCKTENKYENKKIIAKKLGHQESLTLDFKNTWTGDIYDNILITGSNGSGKSLLLRSIASIWSLLSEWLLKEQKVKASLAEKKLLLRWDAFYLEILDLYNEPVVLFFGKEEIYKDLCTNKIVIGEVYSQNGVSKSKLILPLDNSIQ